jgi:hypothetical protein
VCLHVYKCLRLYCVSQKRKKKKGEGGDYLRGRREQTVEQAMKTRDKEEMRTLECLGPR